MREQKQKTIGTTIYAVTQMGAVRSLKVQAKLIKILGQSIFKLVGAGEVDVQKTLELLIPPLMDNFDDKEVSDLVLSLFSEGVFLVEGEHKSVLDFDLHFAGKPFDMWKLAGFILEANFMSGKSEGSTSSSHTTKKDKTQEN